MIPKQLKIKIKRLKCGTVGASTPKNPTTLNPPLWSSYWNVQVVGTIEYIWNSILLFDIPYYITLNLKSKKIIYEIETEIEWIILNNPVYERFIVY